MSSGAMVTVMCRSQALRASIFMSRCRLRLLFFGLFLPLGRQDFFLGPSSRCPP